jgi:hypothetical protein
MPPKVKPMAVKSKFSAEAKVFFIMKCPVTLFLY